MTGSHRFVGRHRTSIDGPTRYNWGGLGIWLCALAIALVLVVWGINIAFAIERVMTWLFG